MLKGIATAPDGKKILLIGLSFGNLKKFKAHPRDTYIRIEGEEMGLPMDVLIFSGETEEKMAEDFTRLAVRVEGTA